MWLPRELAMLVGSYLDPHDQIVCTTQLCSSGAGFVANLFTTYGATICLHELIACCRLSVAVEDVAQECIERIKSFLARHGNAGTVALDAQLWREPCASVDFHHRLQRVSSLQLTQDQGVTVEWHVRAISIAQVEFLLKVGVPKDSARASDSSTSGAIRQYLHTLNLSEMEARVSDVSALASCQSLHTLNLWRTQVSDVSVLASCQSLHTLDLSTTRVSDVSGLGSCQALHTLELFRTDVSDVSALASCQSLHTLNLCHTQVSDVSALGSCQALHTLDLMDTQVSDVSALASCQSLHTLSLKNTQVSDVSALASCRALHTLYLRATFVSNVSALASCQSLHTLDLYNTDVSDVSALASSRSLSKLFCDDFLVGATNVLRIIQGRD
jgi:Leucine-rich repeat (LRR) protein